MLHDDSGFRCLGTHRRLYRCGPVFSGADVLEVAPMIAVAVIGFVIVSLGVGASAWAFVTTWRQAGKKVDHLESQEGGDQSLR